MLRFRSPAGAYRVRAEGRVPRPDNSSVNRAGAGGNAENLTRPHRGQASGIAWSVGGPVLAVAGITVSYALLVFAGR